MTYGAGNAATVGTASSNPCKTRYFVWAVELGKSRRSLGASDFIMSFRKSSGGKSQRLEKARRASHGGELHDMRKVRHPGQPDCSQWAVFHGMPILPRDNAGTPSLSCHRPRSSMRSVSGAAQQPRTLGDVGRDIASFAAPHCVGLWPKRHFAAAQQTVAFGRIVLQKSKVAGLRIFAKNPQREAIADLSYLNRATEVAYEFNVPR